MDSRVIGSICRAERLHHDLVQKRPEIAAKLICLRTTKPWVVSGETRSSLDLSNGLTLHKPSEQNWLGFTTAPHRDSKHGATSKHAELTSGPGCCCLDSQQNNQTVTHARCQLFNVTTLELRGSFCPGTGCAQLQAPMTSSQEPGWVWIPGLRPEVLDRSSDLQTHQTQVC